MGKLLLTQGQDFTLIYSHWNSWCSTRSPLLHPFYCPSHLCYKLSISLCTIHGISRSWSQVGPLSAPAMQTGQTNEKHVHLTWMETDGEYKARGFHWTRSQHRTCSIVKCSNVLQTCRIFLWTLCANRAKQHFWHNRGLYSLTEYSH